VSIQVQSPKHLVSLASSAVLVEVTNSVWTGNETDNQASSEVVQAKGAADGVCNVIKKLMHDSEEHKALNRFMRGTINNGVRRLTYEWAGGIRLLPMANYQKFEAWWGECEGEYKRLLSNLKAVYPDYVSNAAFASQGKLFNRADYPDVGELDSKYKLERRIIPVPMDDFRVQVSQELADDLHKHYCKQAEAIANSIVNEQTNRFVEVMRRLHHSCGFNESTTSNGEIKVSRRKLVRETYEKALEMIDTFKQFNVTEDAQLEQLRNDLEKVLVGKTYEQVAESDMMRAHVGNEIGNVLNKFKLNV